MAHTETTDPWAGIKPAGANFAKWNEPGDRVFGEVVEVTRGETIDGDPCPQIVIAATETGEELTVTASQAQLKNELLRQRPRVGDTVDITYTGVDTTGGRTLKQFSVAVAPAGDERPATHEPTDDEPPSDEEMAF
jgi:hypothetical protein